MTDVHETPLSSTAATPPPTDRLLHSLEALCSSEVLDGAGEPRADGPDALRHQIRRLEQAVAGRAAIDQARGVLMQCYGLDADRSLALLRRWSGYHHTTLRTVAEAVVDAVCRQADADTADPALVRWLEERLRGADEPAHDAGSE